MRGDGGWSEVGGGGGGGGRVGGVTLPIQMSQR